ncbi:MAG: carboxypeptidase regulatory-like domain-containing protein [Coriobacteriales bacterium]|nr:carboxypeptidase regulatory-like domain-containing protein [Coriobacteriales bacterium]
MQTSRKIIKAQFVRLVFMLFLTIFMGCSFTCRVFADSETASNTFLQITELTEAFVMLDDVENGSVETWDGDRVYVLSNSSCTNPDALLLLPYEGFDSRPNSLNDITLPSTEGKNIGEYVYGFILENQTSYHKKNLLRPYADLYGGTIFEQRGSKFLTTLTDGSMCDYGFVVISTHGTVENVHPRDDGSWRSYLMVMDGVSKEELESFKTSFANKYSIPQDEIVNYITTGEKEDELFVSTDFIMTYYRGLTFDNTIFYFGVCGLFRDKVFRNFLIEHGAQAVIGFPYTLRDFVDEGYSSTLGKQLFEKNENAPWRTNTIPEVMNSTLLNKNSEFIDDIWFLPNKLQEYSWIVGMSWCCRSAEFALKGYGDMTGSVVSANGKPVEGAEVIAYRFIGQRFEVKGVDRTGSDGSFKFSSLPWGVYVIDVKAGTWPEVWQTQASIDFSAQSAYCGNIYLATSLEEDLPVNTLEAYFMGELTDSYGILNPQLDIYDASYVEGGFQDGFIGDVQQALSGIISYSIDDFDADDANELLVMRISALSDGITNALYLEMYETLENGSVKRTAMVSYGTMWAASRNHDLRCAVFLNKQTDPSRLESLITGGPVICLYASASMNANFEIIRQLSYTGEGFVVLDERALITAEGWCAEYTKEPYRGEELVSAVLDYTNEGWTLVKKAEVSAMNNTDTMWTDFSAAEAQVVNGYCDYLQYWGIPRNGKRFSYELRDSTDAQKLPVITAFDDNSHTLSWLGEVNCTISWGNGSKVKTIQIINYNSTV